MQVQTTVSSNRYSGSLSSGYRSEHKLVRKQIKELAKILGLESSHALGYAKKLPSLPTGAEGWFAIPSDEGLKSLFPKATNRAERYCDGVWLIQEKLSDCREFCSWCDRPITSDQLRPQIKTAGALDLIAKDQPGDILIVAAQLGLGHRGRSVSQAREFFKTNEFGLGALAVGSIILTDANQLACQGEMGMDCAGDEFNDSYSIAKFSHAPVFYYSLGVLRLGTHWKGQASGIPSAPVSAFIPQLDFLSK